jgi:16S rRNA (uracil1498-N3)-methyltransferase
VRLTRVYLDAALAAGGTATLSASAAAHITRVLRLEVGAALRVFNGQGGEWDATVASIRKDTVTLAVGVHHAVERESPLQITLLQGIARGEKMDLILQKATELGVTRIVPLTMLRSTVKLDAATAQRKQEHWQGVIISACEQCGRNILPLLNAVSTFEHAVLVSQGLKVLLAPDAESLSMSALLAAAAPKARQQVTLLVGPEGGFDPRETAIAMAAGFQRCRLGPRVLRTETAGLAAIVALQTIAGDLT